MKRVAAAVLLLALASAAPSASVVVYVQYLDVPPADLEAFDSAMAGPVREVAEARLEDARIFAWYHYRSRLPLGLDADYTDVLVTVFTDPASLDDPRVSEGYDRWVARAEVFEPVPGIRSEDYYGKVRYTHITVDFMTPGGAGAETFLDVMRRRVKPRLQARADSGTVVNWALFARRDATGDAGYDFAVVSRFDGFSNLETPQIAGAGGEYLRRSAIWRLMDIVE